MFTDVYLVPCTQTVHKKHLLNVRRSQDEAPREWPCLQYSGKTWIKALGLSPGTRALGTLELVTKRRNEHSATESALAQWGAGLE